VVVVGIVALLIVVVVGVVVVVAPSVSCWLLVRNFAPLTQTTENLAQIQAKNRTETQPITAKNYRGI